MKIYQKVKRCFQLVEMIGKFKTIFFLKEHLLFLLACRPSRTLVTSLFRRKPGTQSAPWWQSWSGSMSFPSDWVSVAIPWCLAKISLWCILTKLTKSEVGGNAVMLLVSQVTTAWWRCSFVSSWTDMKHVWHLIGGYSQNTVTLGKVRRNTCFPEGSQDIVCVIDAD